MNFYSSTTTTEPVDKKASDVKFESSPSHHLILVPWEHCNKDTIAIKVTNSPFKIKATSYDGINHHSLEFVLTLNVEVVTLAGTFYDLDEKGFRIHIPKENMKLRKVETLSLQLKTD